jgi:tRNA-specific 2-thiouridylase
LCNAEIKFKAFLDHALQLGADHIATGHYARVRERDGKHELLKAVDTSKDQSYFLHRLTQSQLSRTLFPLGELHKSQIRKIADELQLPNARKKDSTGICFIGERPFREFLNRYLSFKPGPMRTPEGDTVGEHVGLSFYTLGQRKGIGLGGQRAHRDEDGNHAAWYVARKDVETNTLYVVQGHDHPWLLSTALVAGQLSWVAGAPPADGRLLAKTRYRQADVACALHGAGSAEAKLQFEQAQWAVTPGQSAVLYDGEVCLGGGIIERSEAA